MVFWGPFFLTTDLGSGGESVKKMETKTFVGSAAANTAKTELTTVRLLLDRICQYFFIWRHMVHWFLIFNLTLPPIVKQNLKKVGFIRKLEKVEFTIRNFALLKILAHNTFIYFYDYVFIEIYKDLCGKRNVIFSS